ncbi:hypothetical protein [Desulfogranum marinum]|uniref:hypothetical protein n=1 Tax=Desulfogranum marinum TaxID=453220 RepID=UPI001965FA5E|nr:hypothetical protein [Desulfogranum marinum]MBM9513911.1 hypothetical protein [Desulfogranum marinum]
MGCCGQKREALKKAYAKSKPAEQAMESAQPIAKVSGGGQRDYSPPTPHAPAVSLRYGEQSPIIVQGAVTGRQYRFSGTDSVQSIDARDAVSLLRTNFFHQIS